MPVGRWSKANLTVLAALFWLSVGLIAPLIWSFSNRDSVGDAVEASTTDAFTITHPITLSTTPLVRVERGSALFVDSAGQPLRPGSLPPTNNGNIRLLNATISVGSIGGGHSIGNSSDAGAISPLDAMLSNQRYDTLSIRRSTIFIALHGETREAITDVKAEVSLKRRGHAAIKGEGKVRGLLVALDIAATPGQAEKRANGQIRSPFRLTLKSQHVAAAFDGRMVETSGALGLEGPGEITFTSARGIARWLGAYWPSASGLRDAVVRGQMELKHDGLTFEKAVVRMDGNEGAGVLALRFGGARPVVSGTLAYKSVDIAPYLAAASTEGAGGSTMWESVISGPLTVPFGRHLDADLRVSADRVLFQKFDLGPTATTLALKDGRLLADITGIAFNGSEGGGQVTADFNGPQPRLTMRGKLDKVELGQWATAWTGVPGSGLLQGRASVVADVTGSGARLRDVLSALSGKIAVRAQGQGRLSVDLPALLAAARVNETSGWQAGSGSRGWTPYEALDLRLVLRDGALLTDTAELRTTDGIWVATGVANIGSDRIDVRVSQSPATAAASAASAGLAPPTAVLEIKGALSEPRIRVEGSR